MKNLRVGTGVLVTVTGLVLLGAGVTTAQATQPTPTHQVTLCHRTASVDGGNQHNGYDIITVDIASVANARDVRGHDSHEQEGNGPGGDIIPSFTYEDFTYPGKNLGDGGQAFLDNGCNAPVMPAPVVVTTHSDAKDCVTKKVTTTTVTTTTGWDLSGNVWVKGTPVTTEVVTTRDTTAAECPVAPGKPLPVAVVTHSDVSDCAAKKVTTTTVTTTTDWVLSGNVWVKGTPVTTEVVTTRDTTAAECPVAPGKPAPVVVITHSDAKDCVTKKVTTTTVTTTTGWVLSGNVWVKGTPVTTQVDTNRDATAAECPVGTPPVGTPPVGTPPVGAPAVGVTAPADSVEVLGVTATAPAKAAVEVLGSTATAGNPLPAAAGAGAADTSGQLALGGLAGLGGLLALGAGFALRRRHGVI